MSALQAPPITVFDSPELMPPAGHYSHVVRLGDLLFLSGQLPITPAGNTLASESFEAQARQVLANVEACLRAIGAGREHLLAVTVSVTDIADWPTFDALYGEWLGAHRPARAVAQVAALHYGSALEVQATAAAPTSGRRSEEESVAREDNR